MGGVLISKIFINMKFIQPLGPKRALNAAATTTVGSTKGIAVKDISSFLPLNLYLATKYAAGSPIHNVNSVDSVAW